MELLKQRIREEAKVFEPDVLKVDMFLNHQIDTALLVKIGGEFYRLFSDCGITKIVTVEASGIGIACAAAQYFSVPVVYAKKGHIKHISSDVYSCVVNSFTRGEDVTVNISRSYLHPSDHVLVVDDFLANGSAVRGLMDIVSQAGASLAGVGIVIEKGFQPGGDELRQAGIRLESLAIVQSMANGTVTFR